MKRIVISTVIALFALLKFPGTSFAWDDRDHDHDRGPVLPSGLTSVHVNLTVLAQGDTHTNATTTTFHFKQSKIDDNDIFALINTEFATSFSRTNGDQLAVSNFWDGKFIVLGRDGTILLSNASGNTNGDNFVLDLTYSNAVVAGTVKTNCGALYSVADGFLNYESGNGSNSFQLEGLATVSDTWSHGTNSAESFQLSDGIGSASFGTNGVSGVLTGSASGSGKDNAPAP